LNRTRVKKRFQTERFQTALKASMLALLLASVTATTLNAAPHSLARSSTQLDAEISATLDAIVRGDMIEARVLSRSLAQHYPQFALGQLIYAELEATAALDDLIVGDELPMSQSLIDLLLEAQARLEQRDTASLRLNVSDSKQELPADILQIGSHITDLIVVDLADSALYQYKTVLGVPSVVRQHYVGSGTAGFGKLIEGDEKTPLGLYHINGFRDDASLPDLYGSGALMLDYPNALDKHLGRTGSGIWLHGVPHAQHSRAPHSSEGCVTMSNDHLLTLKERITTSTTHVLLTHSIDWQAEPSKDLDELHEHFNAYTSAWASGDSVKLDKLYAKNALPKVVQDSLDAAFLEQKDAPGKFKRVAAQVMPGGGHLDPYHDLKAVDVTQISIVKIPMIQAGDTQHVVMQGRFGSQNENHFTLYWAQNASGNWHIVSEKLVATGT